MPESGGASPTRPTAPLPLNLELPTRETSPPETAVGRWFASGGRLDEPEAVEHGYGWYKVVCLTGVDYFSSLAYQAGIALIAAGALAPIATLILVVVTLFGALPVYSAVARRSFVGQGSIAMLENLLPGWKAKLFVLVLLGFAATDFVITMTLSAADAARHVVENHYLRPFLGHSQFSLTVSLLLVLAIVFFIGFREAIGIAVGVVIPFLLLNLVVLVDGLVQILRHPELIERWRLSLSLHGDWIGVILASAILFPKLALGLSGFETGVSVMPLVEGDKEDAKRALPEGRIRNTRKMLAAAAAIMAVYLILSSFVTALLISPAAYAAGGPASGRAISYLAHRMLGNVFGTFYDVTTILILWFAGASAMAGLINLIPRYLPRFGMAPRWVAYRRPMVAVLLVADLVVTWVFHASVDAQGDAYATGVLVLILSAGIAVTIAFWHEYLGAAAKRLKAFGLAAVFAVVALVFLYTLVMNVIERPDGVIIATVFIIAILVFSATSRYQRAKELRVTGVEFVDQTSAELWKELASKKVDLVPCHAADAAYRHRKAQELRANFRISLPLAFLHVNLLDNRSEFISQLRVKVEQEGHHYMIEVWGAVAIANTIAYLTELLDPAGLFLMLSGRNLMRQSLRYLLLGEGEVGLMVYMILVHYWEWAGKSRERPALFLTTA
jgi:hypothetical protein